MNNIDQYGRTKLFYMITGKRIEEAIQEIKKCDNVNFQDKKGYSYLHCAAQVCSIEVAKELLEKGADIDIKDINGSTPLMVAVNFAVREQKPEILEYLLNQGANMNCQTKSGISPKKLVEMAVNYPYKDLFEK